MHQLVRNLRRNLTEHANVVVAAAPRTAELGCSTAACMHTTRKTPVRCMLPLTTRCGVKIPQGCGDRTCVCVRVFSKCSRRQFTRSGTTGIRGRISRGPIGGRSHTGLILSFFFCIYYILFYYILLAIFLCAFAERMPRQRGGCSCMERKDADEKILTFP